MKKQQYISALPALLLLAAGIVVAPNRSQAAPYACDLTNNSGVISFRLNEDAHNVKVISSGGSVTNDLGSLPKGVTTTNLGISGVFKIAVTRSAPNGYTLSSVDAAQDNGVYLNKFEQARGIAVNKNAASASFGRIFIANSRQANTASPVRTTYQGIYMINSDDTVALDTGTTPRTAGLGFAVSSASPTRLTIGKDDNLLYMCDLSDPAGGLWYTDLDVTTGGNALDHVGDIGTGATTHGSIYAAAVEGSIAGNNLKIFTYDEDLVPVKTAWRYDVNGGPVPFTGSPTGLGQAFINTAIDMVKGGASNYIYSTQNRSAGGEPGLMVFTQDGVLITNSLLATRAYTGVATNADFVKNITAIDMSPDGTTLALLRGSSFGSVLLLKLTNGLFNISDATNSANVFSLGASATSDNNRDIAYDAAGNLYAINTASEWFRIYSRGGPTLATTGSDGSFTIGVPANLVTVAATVASPREGSGTNGVFTFSRSDSAAALTVNFTLTGTGINGTDYQTISTNVTFGIGQSTATVTVIPNNNSIAEFTKTVILTIAPSGNYSAGVPGSATVSILDDEPTEMSVSTVQDRLLESFSGSTATYKISRRGLLTPTVTVNVGYLGAVRGVDFNGPTTVSMPANVATTNFTITPINNNSYSGDRPIACTVNAGSGYAVGNPSAAVVTLLDDEYPAGTILFSDNFETNGTPSWNVNAIDGGADSAAEFAWDYSTYGIPAAPAVTGGTTKGLKLHCNDASGIRLNGLSVSPTGGNFTGDYRLKFDMWVNYNGPMLAGGAGSTFGFTAGLGTAGNVAQIPTLQGDGIQFQVDGDGAALSVDGDYVTFANSQLVTDDSGVYAAGLTTPRNSDNEYYGLFGNVACPPAQLALYSFQTGKSLVGSQGMSWHTVVISKKDETVTWAIDSILIATATNNGAPVSFPTTGNIFVGYYDPYTGTGTNLCFAVVDNLKVETYTAGTAAAPIVYSVQKASATNMLINFVGLASDVAGNFTVLGSPTLSSSSASYTTVAGQSITGSNGLFQASAPISGSAQFFRIRR